MRNDVRTKNGKRIDEASDEKEYWNVVNNITKPRAETKWSLNDEDQQGSENEEEIATKFNMFFVNKIKKLKANIDPNFKSDPLIRLTKKMENKNLKFSLKTVTVKTVTKAMKDMKKKKSAGMDGITQKCLLNGVDVLAIPLTHISTSL